MKAGITAVSTGWAKLDPRLGRMASSLGVVGAIICNGLTPLFWVLRSNSRARARDLLAVPDAGLGQPPR